MKVVNVIGGLGNQMFQYAFALALRNQGEDVAINIADYDSYGKHSGFGLDVFDIDIPIIPCHKIPFTFQNKKIRKVASFFPSITGVCVEKSLEFNESYLSASCCRFYSGYYQSEKYFCKLRDDVLSCFKLKEGFSERSSQLVTRIEEAVCPISIHVRRGDYVTDDKASQTHGICEDEYYNDALSKIVKEKNVCSLFVFSDDENYRLTYDFGLDVTYVHGGEKYAAEDIILMSRCHHHIIANSSFSWWGAWLNKNPNKLVFAPKRWFKNNQLNSQAVDILPKEWVRV